MFRRAICALMAGLFLFVLLPAAAEEQEETFVPEGYRACAFDDYFRELAFISQRELRFNIKEYRYFGDRFVINGCGPASVYNGFAVSFGITDDDFAAKVLLEIMTLLSNYQKPEKYANDFRRMSLLTSELCDNYPTLTEMKSLVDQVIWMEKRTTAKNVKKALEPVQGSAVLIGRINLSQNWGEIIDLAEELHAQGRDEAILTVTNLATGTDDMGTPFCLGDNGHFITLTMQVGEFLEHGTIYVLDSYPRAVRGEKLKDPYDLRYYFAANNKLTGFRTHYYAYHVKPAVVKCEPREEIQTQLTEKKAAASRSKKAAGTYRSFRIKLAIRINTYGTGTLLLRIP